MLAFAFGLFVLYALSAGPTSSILGGGQPEIYGAIYRPLYFVSDRLPDPMFQVFNRYVSLFGNVPNLSFQISRDQHHGIYPCHFVPDPPSVAGP
jgi:hypothetical protein